MPVEMQVSARFMSYCLRICLLRSGGEKFHVKSSGAFRPFVCTPYLQHPGKCTFRCGMPRDSSEEACYKNGIPSFPTFFVCQGPELSFFFPVHKPYPRCNHICPAMPSRKNSSLERDARSYNDSMGTKYESAQDYYTRFPNGWARIRCDTVTH